MRKLLLATAAIGLLAAIPAAAQPMRGLPCIRQTDIRNFHSDDNKTLILENGRHQRVMARLMGICPGLNYAFNIRIKTFGGSELSCISRGDQVLVNDAGFRGKCVITQLTAYDGPMSDRNRHDRYHDRDNDRHDNDRDNDRDNGHHHNNSY